MVARAEAFSVRGFRTENAMRLAKLAAALILAAGVAACGGHHGQIFHQDRPGGTDFNAAHPAK
jgi:hypothetical protein